MNACTPGIDICAAPLPEGEKPNWRGSTISSNYEFANPLVR
jgi:hypothetical protein